jgi:hypothetical protein
VDIPITPPSTIWTSGVGIENGIILATAPLTTTASSRKSTIETVSKTSLHMTTRAV